MRPSLEELITRRQDELRGRPLNWRDHLSDNFRYIDWPFVGLCVCVTIWAVCYTFIEIVKLMAIG